jgi:hypothetical protein
MEPDRGRRQRVAAGVVGLVVFVAAVWLVTTGGPFAPSPRRMRSEAPVPTETPAPTALPGNVPARVGFVGLPPEGAPPSRPRSGRLVLSYLGRQFARWYQVWVYADGRLIWQREGHLPEGANELATGFLEQRLTPEGVDMLQARGSAEAALFGFPWRPPYPASWLPRRAWEQREIGAYVPSRYAVCYQGLLRPIEPSRILRWLPAPAAERLRAGISHVRSVGGWLRGFGGACSDLTTEEARSVSEALEGEGVVRQDEFQWAYGLTYYYYLKAYGPSRTVVLRFEPILPHGEVACSGCG